MQKVRRKRKKKNKTGFTLVEVLAAVTILGILSVVAITSITAVIQNAKENHYSTAEDEMELAGQSYVQQNRSDLPKSIGQKTTIPLKTLVDKKYIQPIKDYSDNECDLEKSYVQVFKYSQDNYSYLAYLKCPNYTSKTKSKDYRPAITLTITGEEKTAHAKYTIIDDNKLMSYSYIIYQGSKEVFNSGSIFVKNYDTKVEKEIDLSTYTPGKIKVVITATNIYGNSTTVSKEGNYTDGIPPVCIIAEEDQKAKDWLGTGSRTITVKCSDGNGSGCSRDEYTKTFTESAKTGIITIEDKSGLTTDCEVSVYIDNSPPTIKVTAYKKTSSGGKGDLIKSVTTSLTEANKILDLSTETSTGWLNKENYQYGIYYEVEIEDSEELNSYTITQNAPSLPKTSPDVDNINRAVTSGEATGVSKKVNFNVNTDGYRKHKIVVKDTAGNTSEVIVITPLDRTSPTVPTVNMYTWLNNETRPTESTNLATYTNNTWSALKVYTTATGSTDTLSETIDYEFNATGTTTNETVKKEYRSVEADGISYIKYRACDIAGNCSAYTSNKTIKIDKTPPTCTSSGGSDNWTNGTVTLKGTCSDTGSGCEKTTITTTISDETNGTVSPGKVKDNVGNESTCPVQTVKIDKTPPTCTSSGGSATWTTSRTITGTCSDAGSGCAKTEVTKTYNTTTTNTTTASPGVVSDNAGNSTTCPANQTVKVDLTKPSCTTTISNSYWTNQNVTLTGTCSDADSGCATPTVTQTFNTEMSEYKSPGTVKDAVGNERVCPTKNVRIDKTAPYVSEASVNDLYMTQWDKDSNVLPNAYVKSKSCSGITCTATICLQNKTGSFNVFGFSFTGADELSGYYTYELSRKMYDKNGNITENGCLSSRSQNACRYEWTYTIFDRAGNTSNYIVNYAVGYIGLGDATGC